MGSARGLQGAQGEALCHLPWQNKELNLDPDEEVPTSSRSLCLPQARVHF